MPPPSQKTTSPTEVVKASSYSRDLTKNGLGGVNSQTPSLASRNLSVQHNTRSQSLSSVKDITVKVALPGTGDASQCQISLESDRSEIKSLDDLFSKAADSEDSISSSSDGKLVLKHCLGRLGMNCTNNLLINLLIKMGKCS